MVKTSNIPLFNSSEIEEILNINKFPFNFQYLNTLHKELTNIINHPYFLNLFIEEFSQNHSPLSEFSILEKYIRKKIHSLPYQEEKLEIIDRFITLCEWGKETNSVKKSFLLQKTQNTIAYSELISNGIIYEYIIPYKLVENNTFVKFNHSIIFEFILFEKWITNKEINTSLFFEIRDYYINNIQLQCNLLKFFTEFLIFTNNLKMIKQLHMEFEKKILFSKTQPELPQCILIFSSVITKAFQTNQQFRKNFYPWILRSQLFNILYSEL